MKPAVWVAGVAVAVSRFLCAARVPDDYDSIGFVASITDFDMARLQPHFPGYPVYVALLRLMHLVVADPLTAATATSALAAGATMVGIWVIAHELGGTRAAWLAAGFYAVSSLPWILGGSALSDTTATAVAVWAFAALTLRAPLVAAALLSLMLGVRASYWPIWVSGMAILIWQNPIRSLLGSMVGALLWLLPFVVVERNLWQLGRTHLRGHFTVWGGSIATRPGLGHRTFCLLRAIFFDGLSPSWFLVAATAFFILAWRFRKPPAVVIWLAAPYLLWVLLAQNIIDQPRHALPLVVGLIVLLACATATRPVWALAAMVTMLAGSAPLAVAHATELPPPEALARWVAVQTDPLPVAVFGGRSLRFLRNSPSLLVRERTWLSEVDVELGRFDILPRTIWITSEVDQNIAARLTPGPRFCRDPRLDRAQPCVQWFRYLRP